MSYTLEVTDRAGRTATFEAVSGRLTVNQFVHTLVRREHFLDGGLQLRPSQVCLELYGFPLVGTASLRAHVSSGARLTLVVRDADRFAAPGLESSAMTAVGLSAVRVGAGMTRARPDGKTAEGLAKEALDAMTQRLDLRPQDLDFYTSDGAAAAARRPIAMLSSNYRAATGDDDVGKHLKGMDCMAHATSDAVKAAMKQMTPNDAGRQSRVVVFENSFFPRPRSCEREREIERER